MSSADLVGLARVALAEARSTGRFAGVKASSADVKRAARIARAHGGRSALRGFLTGQGGKFHRGTLITDARYGYDEVDYPKGEPKLPRGALSGPGARTAAVNDAPSEMGRINSLILRGGISQRGLR